MKRGSAFNVIALISAASAVIFSGCASAKPVQGSLPGFLSAKSAAAIAASDTVTAALLEGGSTDASIPSPETMAVARTSAPLKDDARAALVRIILSPDSYRTDISRKVPFLATWKLTFSGAKGMAVLFVGKECVQVKEAGTPSRAEEFDPVASELIALVESALKD